MKKKPDKLNNLSLKEKISEAWKSLYDPLSVREKAFFSLAALFVVGLIIAQNVGASVSDYGSIFSIPASTCTDSNTWINPHKAAGQPDVDLYEDRSKINESNSASWNGELGNLDCFGFSTDEDHYRVDTYLNLSIRALYQEPPEVSSDNDIALDDSITQPIRINERAEPVLPNAYGVPTEPSTDSVLLISVSKDYGKNWTPLHLMDLSLLTLEDPHVSIAMPDEYTNFLDKLQIRAEAISDGVPLTIFIDSVGVTYEVGKANEIEFSFIDESGEKNLDAIPVIGQEKEVNFVIKTKDVDDGFWQGVKNNALSNEPVQPQVITEIVSNNGEQISTQEQELEWLDTDLSNANSWEGSVTMPVNSDPGAYSLNVLVVSEEGTTQTFSQDFLWGVLAMNTDKDWYSPGETAEVQMTVLDEIGATVCNAELRLFITDPSGNITENSTNNDLISKADTCTEYGSHINADYLSNYEFSELGQYEFRLNAVTDNGEYQILSVVEVDESKPFSVERVGPTRIFPLNDYPMTIVVSSENDFEGTITEYVPSEIVASKNNSGLSFDKKRIGDEITKLEWYVSIEAGKSIILTYNFDAPDISPEFYLFGPLSIDSTNEESTWSELRQWQVASDAVGRMILFWDGATAPSGWTCISCTSGDPFYQTFIRGDTSYGGTGGSATHAHTASSSVAATGAAGVGRTGTATASALNTHSHSVSTTLGNGSNLPSYRQLKVIRYNSTGAPATLPAGAIAIFDAAVPVGWTRYSAQDNYYTYGENTVGSTSGSDTHNHSISGSITAPTATSNARTGGATVSASSDTHTHTFSGTSDTVNQEPPYLNVILGKINASGSIPDDLIAMWDEDPPGGWVDVSQSGDDFYQRFMIGAATYGGTGGSATHSHVNASIASGAPSATVTIKNQLTSFGSSTHTHNVNVTGFSAESNLPPYRNVRLAQKTTITSYEQSAYRFFNNNDSTDVGSALAAQDTAAVAPAQGTPFRLRALIHVNGSTAATSADNFKLQYSEQVGTCDTSFTGETYVDVATASGDIRYYNNTTPADGAALTSNANDPTHSSHTVNDQTYEESNTFTNSQSAIAVGEDGQWDFALVDSSAPENTTYCFRIVLSDNSTIATYSSFPEITTADAPSRMIVLYDGATTPSGWTCISCTSGDPAYQRFVRGDATYNTTGGSADHNHTATGSVTATADAAQGATNSGTINVSQNTHAHTFTPTIANASNLPLYRQLKIISYDTGTPATLPIGAIIILDSATIPTNMAQYSAQDGFYLYGENTVGTTGGSNTHTHNITGALNAASGATTASKTGGAQVGVASSNHTHDASSVSPASSNEPPYREAVLARVTTATAVPNDAITMWDDTVPSGWTCISCTSGDAFHQLFIKPATTYGTTGGGTTHTHTDTTYNSGAPIQTTTTRSGTIDASNTHIHSIDVTNFSTDNNLPPYINMILGKFGTNTAPNSPTSLVQERTTAATTMAVGDWTNETQATFEASVTDTDNPDSLALCVEVQPIASAFTNTENGCGSSVSYTGTAITVDVDITGLVGDTEYHWQARTRDSWGAYSAWVSYGANAESARDFGVDLTGPTGGTVFDGTTIGVDVDYNNGTLDTLSANWSGINSNVSGLSGYEYSIGTTAAAVDVLGWTTNGTSTSFTEGSLNLNTSQPYYVNVRTTDNASNTSVISSDGQFVSPTLSFSTTPGTVSFSNLNSSNGYTDTEVTVVNSSTNAYNGYIIRAYATGLLTSLSNTIAMFDGGTYASPDEWLPGDTGWGHTSSDTSIQGSNKFNPVTCAGGGSSPCYAPVSLTAPGDIVADHTSLVTGTPITNEQFNITHRVTTSSTQPPGTYTSTIIYLITAVY